MVNMDNRAPEPAQPAEVGPFPMTTPNFIKVLNTDPMIKKLRTINDNPEFILSEEQFQLLPMAISSEWWQLVRNIITIWPTSKSWVVMDILRARILDSNTRSIINPTELAQLVMHIASQPDNNDFAILGLSRIIGNMFANYAGEATSRINIITIFTSISAMFSTLTPRTQVSFANALMNYSAFLANSPDDAVQLMDILLDVFDCQLDEETLYRILYALGNCITFSPAAKEQLILRSDLLDRWLSSNPGPKTSPLITALVGKLN